MFNILRLKKLGERASFFGDNSQINFEKHKVHLLTSSMSSSSSPMSSNWISSSSPGPNVSVSLILAKETTANIYYNQDVIKITAH